MDKKITIKCDICGNLYETKKRYWQDSERRGFKHCCSKKCAYQSLKTGKIIKCSCCGRQFYRKKSDINESKNNFCSLECAHKTINHIHYKTQQQKEKISVSLKKYFESQQFQEKQVKNKKEKQKIKIKKQCPVCKNDFFVSNWQKNKIYCTRKCYNEDNKLQYRKKVFGGLRRGSSRTYHGWYKGFWCDSSWQLAFVIYNLQHNIKFYRNKEGFSYYYNNQKHMFYPDFIMQDGTFIQIKGYMDEQNICKIEQFKYNIIVLNKNKMQIYLKYVKEKYGKDFLKLYENL